MLLMVFYKHLLKSVQPPHLRQQMKRRVGKGDDTTKSTVQGATIALYALEPLRQGGKYEAE